MKKRLVSVAAGAVALVAAAVIPANASPANGTEVPSWLEDAPDFSWLEDAPDFPIEPGTSPDELTPEDIEAIASFQAEFPWAEAFAAFGCAASDITYGDDGGKSMMLDCAEATVDFDDVLRIPATAIAATEGDADAIAALTEGPVASQSTVTPMFTSCGNTGNQRHCLDNNATYFMASSLIRTLSGSSTGTNRLGSVGIGNPCADGALMNQSVRLTISTTVYSFVDSPSFSNTQFSSRWTMSPFSYSRYCAVV